VTRFGEFSLNGQLFTLSNFFKITTVDQMFGANFVRERRYVLILIKRGLGYVHSGLIFHKVIRST
jgi:hypothetical protein